MPVSIKGEPPHCGHVNHSFGQNHGTSNDRRAELFRQAVGAWLNRLAVSRLPVIIQPGWSTVTANVCGMGEFHPWKGETTPVRALRESDNRPGVGGQAAVHDRQSAGVSQ